MKCPYAHTITAYYECPNSNKDGTCKNNVCDMDVKFPSTERKKHEV